MASESELTEAKLQTVEARAETRFVELSAKMDRVADSFSSLKVEIDRVHRDVKEEGKLTRWTIVALVIAGLAALWVTQSNMLASFTAGIAVHEANKPSAAPSAPTKPQQ